jgi:hypothetical protein
MYIFRSFLIVSFVLWYILPFLLSVLGYWDIIELITGTLFDNYLRNNCFEVWFYVIILMIFKFSKKLSFLRSLHFGDNLQSNKWFLPVIIIFTLVMLVYNFIFRLNYSEVNEIENAEGGIFFVLNVLNNFVQSFIWICIIKRSYPQFLRLFIVIIIAYIFFYVLSGSRIYLLALLWLFLFVSKERILAHKFRYFVPLTSLVVLFLVLLPILASWRTGESDDEELNNVKQINQAVLNQLNVKLNAVGYTSVLLDQDGVGFAGTKPYVGSMLKFLPRALWKDKPTPTSYNGDISGTPSRRIPYLLTGENGIYNVGVSPGLTALWHGWYSVILSILLSVLLLWILRNTLASESLIMNSVGFSLFYFPQLIMIPSTGDNIIQKLLEMVIILVLLFFTSVLSVYKVVYKSNE